MTTARIMLLPIVRYNNGKNRAAKYIKSRFNPGGIDVEYSLIDYGLVDTGFVAALLTDPQIAQAQAQPDITMIPENLDTQLGATAVLNTANALEALQVPADWVTTDFTYRGVLRRTLGFFQFMQRLSKLAGDSPFSLGIDLTLQFSQLNATWQGRVRTAALDLALMNNSQTIPQTWTFRRILGYMGEQWGDREIRFGNIITV